ncbi:MAG: YiiD C-terminal domain-containing protein [Gammaproteobacteria bacterium]
MCVNTSEQAARWTARLETLWRDEIPLARAMEAAVERLDGEGLVATAPLSANRNHMGTAFGGSLQALATLAGWAVTLVAAGEDSGCRVVVAQASTRFLAPLKGPLRARARWPAAEDAESFRRRLEARGRARLTVEVRLGDGDRPAAEFTGDFVAMRRD